MVYCECEFTKILVYAKLRTYYWHTPCLACTSFSFIHLIGNMPKQLAYSYIACKYCLYIFLATINALRASSSKAC